MASNFDPFDFNTYTPSWLDEDKPKETGVDLNAQAAIQAIEDDLGRKLSSAERDKVLRGIAPGGEFTIRNDSADGMDPFDFNNYTPSWVEDIEDEEQAPVLPSRSRIPESTPIEEPSISGFLKEQAAKILGYGGAAVDAAQGTAQEAAGQAYRYASEEGGPLAQFYGTNTVDAIANPAQLIADLGMDTREETAVRRMQELQGAGLANKIAVEAYRKKEGLGEGFAGGIRGIGLDVAANPDIAITQIAQLVPGIGTEAAAVLATAPGGRVFLNEYYSMLDKGVPKEEAKARAMAMAGIEYAMEATPGLKWGKVIDDVLAAPIKGVGRRVAESAVEEFVQEAATETVQGGLDTLLSSTDIASPELKKAAEERDFDTTADFMERVAYAGTVGSVAGGGMRLSVAPLEVAAAQGHQVARTLNRSLEESFREQANAAKKDTDIILDIKAEQERIAQEKAKADVEQRLAAEEAAAAQRKADETEAIQRTGERQRLADTLSQNPAVRVAPVAAVSAEEVAAERLAAEKAEAQRLERVELGRKEEQLRKEQAAAAKPKVTKGKKAAPKPEANLADVSRKQQIGAIHKVKKDLGLDDAAYRQLLKQVTGKDSSKGMSQEERQNVLKAMEQVRAGKPVTVKPAAPAVAEAAPAVNDQELEDADIRKLVEEKLGVKAAPANPSLKMAGGTDSKGDFVPKAERIVKGLVKRNTQQTADVQNLLRQGKLIMAPNAQSIGREADESQAQFDPETGKMYLYLDKIDDKDVVPTIMAALHEATHAGQFNNRAGRPDILKQMMGKEMNNKVKDLVAKSYGKNGLATRAVDQAVKAAKAAGNSAEVADLEVLPYFVSEAIAARNKGLGRLGGAVRDIKAAAKDFVRSKLGVDMDITLDEIESAAQKVGGEIVATTTKPTKGKSLDMIGGLKAKEPKGQGYVGAVDRKVRWEFSDENAELVSSGDSLDDAADREVRRYKMTQYGSPMRLEDMLNHELLYRNYPETKDIIVKVNPAFEPGQHGSMDVTNNKININSSLLAQGNEEQLISTILHEVQHWIQAKEGFVAGANTSSFIDPKLQENVDKAKEEYKKVVDNFDVDAALDTLTDAERQLWEKSKGWQSTGSIEENFLVGGFANSSSDKGIVKQALDFQRAQMNLDEATTKLELAKTKAFKAYMRDYGETEARNTEHRRKMTDAERKAAPPETTMKNARGKVDVKYTMDTRPLRGKPDMIPASEAESSLNMAASKPSIPKENLSTKETLRRVIDHGTRSQTADVKLAEDLDTRYRRALAKDMKGRKNLDETNEEIMSALTAVDNADPAARKRLWANFKNRYPNLAPVLQQMRDTIDRNTHDYITTLVSSGRTLSKKEMKEIRTLLANEGKYLTRAYSAFQRNLGRPWAENRWADYKNKLKSFLADSSKLPAKTKKNVEEVLRAVQFIEKQLVIPDNQKLEALNVDKLSQMYEDHIGPVNRLDYEHNADDELAARRKGLVDALATRRDMLTPEHYNNMAEQVVKELLGLDEKTSHYSRIFSDLSRDPGTLKKREHVPLELRNLLGEITNPGGVVLSTLSTQAALNARARVIHDLLTTQVGTLVIPASRITEPGMREKFPMPLNGDQYGQLDGFYATKHTFDALTDMKDVYFTYGEALRRINRPSILASKLIKDIPRNLFAPLTRTEKILGVVLKPYNWAGNLLGSPINMVRSGNVSPTSALKGIVTARDYVQGTLYNTTTELLEEAIKYVNIEAVDVSEMQRVLGDKIANYMEGTISAENVTDFIDNKLSTKQKAKRGYNTTVATYAMMDAWVKIANFHERVDTLSRYYKALGADITADEIKREAGDVTSYTNLSSERVPGYLKIWEQNGLTKFIPYFSETMRTTWTNIAQGMHDLGRAARTDNPKAANILRRAAARRLIGSFLATGLLPAQFPIMTNLLLGTAAFALAGDDDDSEKKRRMLNEFYRYQDFLPFGFDKDKRPVFLPISSRIDPNGPATDIVRIFANTEDNQETFDAIKNYLGDLIITPTWMQHLYAASTRDTVPQSKLAANFPAATDAAGDFMSTVGTERTTINKALYSIESLVPGLAIMGVPKYKVQLAENADEGQRLAIKTLEGLGASFETFEPSRALRGYGIEASEQKTSNRAALADNILLRSEINEDNTLDAITSYRVKEQARYDIGRRSYESLAAWGIKDNEIKRLLVEAGWAKREAEDIVAGDDTSILSLRSLADSKRGKEDEEKLKAALDIIKKNKRQLAEIGIEVRKD